LFDSPDPGHPHDLPPRPEEESMIRQNGLTEIDQYAMQAIQCRVRSLIGHYGIVPDDRDDLIQQLFLEYLERSGGFDPARGRYKTFVNCLIRNQVVSLIRARKRRLREATLCGLPSATAEDLDSDASFSHSNDLSEDAYRIATGLASRPAADLLNLRIDVDRAFNSLPPNLREVGSRVVEDDVRTVSQALGRSPARVYQLLWKMRPVFVELGFMPATGGVQ
jgi:RNA polymerase sigma factor (sigma-70 family)